MYIYKMYCIVCYHALAPLHQLHHHRRSHHHHKQIALLCFLDLYIYKNKFLYVKELSWAINYIITINPIIVVIIIVVA